MDPVYFKMIKHLSNIVCLAWSSVKMGQKIYIFTCWHLGFITEIQYNPVQRTYKLWQGAQGTHKIPENQIHFANTSWCKYFIFFTLYFVHTITLLANQGLGAVAGFRCGSALQVHSQVLLNPVTEHRKITQIHDDLPLLTTDLQYQQESCWDYSK